MTTPTETYLPPNAPRVNNDEITVSQWLRRPTLQRKSFDALTFQQFIADFLFRPGTAEGGAVIYDKLTEAALWADGEPGVIEPGNEFPIVGVEDPTPRVALAVERGLAFLTTYKAEKRNQMSVITKGTRRITNTMIRNHNAIAVGAFFADPDIPTGDAAAAWSDPATSGKKKLADVRSVISEVENGELGYTVDTAVLHPDTALNLLNDDWIVEHLPKEGASNPLLNNELANLAGLPNWLTSRRVPVDKIGFTKRGAAGSINVEEGLWTRTIDDPINRRWLTQCGRSDVPVIDEPLAAFILDIG